MLLCFFFFKQKTAYEMRISDWSSDVCSSDLNAAVARHRARLQIDGRILGVERVAAGGPHRDRPVERHLFRVHVVPAAGRGDLRGAIRKLDAGGEIVELDDRFGRTVLHRGARGEHERPALARSEEHTSELPS